MNIYFLLQVVRPTCISKPMTRLVWLAQAPVPWLPWTSPSRSTLWCHPYPHLGTWDRWMAPVQVRKLWNVKSHSKFVVPTEHLAKAASCETWLNFLQVVVEVWRAKQELEEAAEIEAAVKETAVTRVTTVEGMEEWTVGMEDIWAAARPVRTWSPSPSPRGLWRRATLTWASRHRWVSLGSLSLNSPRFVMYSNYIFSIHWVFKRFCQVGALENVCSLSAVGIQY